MTPEETDLAAKVAKQVDRAERPHKQRCGYYKKCDEIYNAKLKASDDKWRSDLHPPYVQQYVETIVASIVDEPSDPVVEPLRPQDKKAAEKLSELLKQQEDEDHFAEKWPLFVRQGLIRGFTVAKIPWAQEYRLVTERSFVPQMGMPIPREGKPKTTRKMVKDQPSFELVDAEDFWWNDDARSPEEWDCVYFRTYQTMRNLRLLEKDGIYKNIDDLGSSAGSADNPSSDSSGGPAAARKAGRVEIVEVWTEDRLITIADRKVILRDEPNPYGTGLLPFIAARPIPRPFTVVGWSLCELIGELQVAAWDAMNHRADNANIMSNAVLKYRQGMADVDQLGDRFPGQRIALQDMGDLVWDMPPTSIIEPLLAAEERIKSDMQDLTGAVAYLSGADSGTIDQTTATGISIIQSTAQKRLLAVKQEFANARNRMGQQWIELNKTLMTTPEILRSFGADGFDHDTLFPHEVAGAECRYVVADVGESLNQQQKRSEAILKLNTLAALAPLMQGSLNLTSLVQDFSEAFGDDRNAYLNETPPMGMLPGSGPGLPLPPGGPPTGATTPPSGAGPAVPPPPVGQPPYVNNAPNGQAA